MYTITTFQVRAHAITYKSDMHFEVTICEVMGWPSLLQTVSQLDLLRGGSTPPSVYICHNKRIIWLVVWITLLYKSNWN